MFEPSSINPDATDADVFQSSRKPLLFALVALSAVSVFAMLRFPSDHPWNRFFGMPTLSPQLFVIGGVLCLLILGSLWGVIRPVRLIANRSGFTLTGGLSGASKIWSWNDVERFFVEVTAHGNRVACTLKPGAQSNFGGPDGALKAMVIFAGFRPADPEQVVAQLNALRRRAVGDAPAVADAADDGFSADQSSAPQWVEPKTIQASAQPYLIQLAFLAMPIALMIYMGFKGGRFFAFPLIVLTLILAPFILLYLWLATHPPVLSLDRTGFTYPGGLIRSPKTVPWKDLQDFAIYERMSSRGYAPPRIAYFLHPGAPSVTPIRDIFSWSPQKLVPWFYVSDAAPVVAQLNAYRQQALGLTRSSSTD